MMAMRETTRKNRPVPVVEWLRWYCVGLLTTLILASNFGHCQAQSVKIVDTRLLLLAHPLMQRFSAIDQRFMDTPSAPVTGEQGVNALSNQRSRLEHRHQEATDAFKQAFAKASSPAEKRRLEAEFFARQKSLRQELKKLETRLQEVRRVPTRVGMTTDQSITPQIEDIVQDIRAVLKQMALSHPGPILDIAGYLPHPESRYDTRVLGGNRNQHWWTGNRDVEAADLQFLKHAKLFLSFHAGPYSPVPHGAKDGREESLTVLEQVTKGK